MRTGCRRGVTLYELAMVLVLVGIAASLAYPSMTAWLRRVRTQQALNTLTADLHYARMLAVRSGRTAVVRFAPAAGCPAPGPGMRGVAGSYAVVVRSAPEQVAKRAQVGVDGVALCLQMNGPDSIAYNSRGLLHGFMNRTVKVDHHGVRDSLTVSVVGRVYRRF